jgi:hypothetical protein
MNRLGFVLVVAAIGLGACRGENAGDDSSNSRPSAPTVTLSYGIKQLQFSWGTVSGATHYRLLEDPDGVSGYAQIGSDITVTGVNHDIALFRRVNARYIVQACDAKGCTDSSPISPVAGLVPAIGYFKASNTGPDDRFGVSIALSADGNTLAIGSESEDSNATGVNGDESDTTAWRSGAVYVFVRSGNTWAQQAYVKASNTEAGDYFGWAIALSADGNTLAVGAYGEDSKATGVNGDSSSNTMTNSGAAYVFTRSGTTWSQQAYVKASNAGFAHFFGFTVALSADGETLAVGASGENTGAPNPATNLTSAAGAVYVFTRSAGAWMQQAYLKASNPEGDDYFGFALALSADGGTIAVGAGWEDSRATGIDGEQSNDEAQMSGAVYVFARSGNSWSQQAYVKAPNTDANDEFGRAVALSADGNTLAVGATGEDGKAVGIDGDWSDNTGSDSGAVYVFVRSGTAWSQQAYVKASNTEAGDFFGYAVALSADGNTLAVGASGEDSNVTGVSGSQAQNTASMSGATYVFARSRTIWSQLAYVKASNTDASDSFGRAVMLSADGNTLAVGACFEGSSATGVGGDQGDNANFGSGVAYLY